MTSLLLGLAFLLASSEPSLAGKNVLCNGGDGAPFWADTMNECLTRARDTAGSDAREIAREGERAERRARDSKRIADRLSADRKATQALSPEAQRAMWNTTYSLGNFAPLAASYVAAANGQGSAAPYVPKTYGELLGSTDPAKSWNLQSVEEAQVAADYFKAATGGVAAANRLNELSKTTLERKVSLLSLGSGQGAPTLRGQRSGSAESVGGEKGLGHGASVAMPKVSSHSAVTEPGTPSPLAKGEYGKSAAGTGKGADSAKVPELNLEGKPRNSKALADLEDPKKKDKKGSANASPELDLFEAAMNKADREIRGDNSVPASPDKMGAVSAMGEFPPDEQAGMGEYTTSIFTRVTQQYRKRARIFFSPFRE